MIKNYFLNKFYESKLDEKNILDLFSVVKNIRSGCLIHYNGKNIIKVQNLIKKLGLKIVLVRKLLMFKDIYSCESILIEKENFNTFYQKINNKNYNKKEYIKKFLQGSINEIFISKKKTKIDFNKIGKFLNYPECCNKFYEGSKGLNKYYNIYFSKNKVIDWRLNRLIAIFNSPFFMPDFFPCHLNCPKAINLCQKYINLAKKIFDKKKFDKITNLQKSPILINKNNIYLFDKWSIKKNNLFINSSYSNCENLSKVFTPKKKLIKLIFHKKINKVYFKTNNKLINVKFI